MDLKIECTYSYIFFEGNGKRFKLDRVDLCDVWETYGGSFCSALGKCLLNADQENAQKIYDNWKHYIEKDYYNGLFNAYLKEC